MKLFIYKTLIVIFGRWFGKLQALFMIILSYLGLFYLSLGLNNKLIFYVMIISLPLSLNILNDIYHKEGVIELAIIVLLIDS